MSDPFLGEIKIVPYNFAPRGWANCDGQILLISQNTALFSLIGTVFGGDAITTMALPDLRGRLPMHTGTGPGLAIRDEGDKGGTETESLQVTQMPSHNHGGAVVSSSDEGDRTDPDGAYIARPEEPLQPYAGSPGGTMSPGSVQIDNSGGGQPVNNMPPFLVLRFVIALAGIYPSRN